MYDVLTKLWINLWYVIISAANWVRKLFGKPGIGK